MLDFLPVLNASIALAIDPSTMDSLTQRAFTHPIISLDALGAVRRLVEGLIFLGKVETQKKQCERHRGYPVGVFRLQEFSLDNL